MICLCGHRLIEHDETGRCRPVRMIGASQSIGPILLGSCECEWPKEPAPLQLADETRLREAVDAFGRDVLGSWSGHVKLWTTPTDRKEYRAAKTTRMHRNVAPADFLAHLRGEHVAAVAPIGRAIVIDADLAADESAETKEKGRAHVALILDTFGIPHVHHDGRSGFHTWIRLHRDPSDDEKKALAAILAEKWDGQGGFQVFPLGGTALRLPFGLYLERPRQTAPSMDIDAMLAWLAAPERATDEQLAALVTSAPGKPEPDRTPASPAARPLETVTAPRRTKNEGHLPRPRVQEPITGWNRWPDCKQVVAQEGAPPRKRHDTLVALAHEAVESGERNEKRLARWLASIPRPNSTTPGAENDTDAKYAATNALRLFMENDPRRFSSCPQIPNHSGWQQSQRHRATFQHECSPERAANCPIYQKWHQAQNLPAFAHILRSSIWRGGQGPGAGLGHQAKLAYQVVLRRSGGDPDLVFPASLNWVGIYVVDEGIRRAAIPKIMRRLAQEDLIEKVGQNDDGTSLYRVPFRSQEWIDAKEAELGTSDQAQKARDAILRDWNKPARRRAA